MRAPSHALVKPFGVEHAGTEAVWALRDISLSERSGGMLGGGLGFDLSLLFLP